MAAQVAGELYYDIDGQLAEIKRQLRQTTGYPYDPVKLKVALQDAIEGRFVDSARSEVFQAAPAKPNPLLAIIRVDRSIRPVYPDWADKKWVNDEKFMALEKTGPSEYGLQSIEQWLHDRQKNGGRRRGQVIQDYLTSSNMLESCLGLADLLAIQKFGIEIFRKHFAGKAAFGWKSVVRDRDGDLRAPYLVGDDGRVELGWGWLDGVWGGSSPALRFAS